MPRADACAEGGDDLSGLQRFENRLEQMISGVFARTFRSAVQPVEISSALAREVDNSAQVLSRDRRLAPNDFLVELSEPDHARLSALGSALPDELVELLKQHATAQSYVFTGPVGISLEIADDLTTGRFRVSSKTMAKVTQPGPEITDTQVRRATAYLDVHGDRMPLSPPGIVIGRGTDADLRVNDPGVSRRHVEIRVTDDEDGPRVSVHDLGSTNGVLVNGKKVENAAVTDGAVIRVGNTTMTLHQRQV
ncbi:MAG: FhaA domain-containing protein [Marmoricola sp.]